MRVLPVYIFAAVRSPIGSWGGVLSSLSAIEIATQVVKHIISKNVVGVSYIEEAYIGNVISANLGQAPARQVIRAAGLSDEIACTTVNKVCASGLKAVTLAAQSIQLNQSCGGLAGGMESMSNIPYYLSKARYGYKYGNGELIDGMLKDGLTDVYEQLQMGVFADRTATHFKILRAEQDTFAITSYERSAKAWEAGAFVDEVVPISITSRGGEIQWVSEDEEYKRVQFEKISTLRPAFTTEGTVTAANASTISDGAAFLLIGGEKMRQDGSHPMARIVAYADAEQKPEWFTLAPIVATQRVLEKAGLTVDQIDFFEVNEAFSIIPLVYKHQFGIDSNRLNIHGGAVSLGHPLGASGARILTTLVHILRQRKGRYGLAAICNGGGGATAILIENIDY